MVARRYTLGITVFVNADGSLGLYENGLRQNAVFLYNLFRRSDRFEKIYLLNHGDGEVDREREKNAPVDLDAIVRTPDVEHELDFVICIGAAIDEPTVNRLRKRGTKLISYRGGNSSIISMEATISSPPRADASRFFDVAHFDAIWMTQQHLHTNRGFTEIVYRKPVIEIPQIWQSIFLESRATQLKTPFGYRSGVNDRRVAILDPNITVMKTSHMPMLVCEAAFRRAPAALQQVLVCNASHLNQNDGFKSFCHMLTIITSAKLTLEARFPTADFLSQHANAVVTHHWENGLNYLYYDVLYGGYPLIHNSEYIRDFGYYYPSWDAMKGGEVLIEALETHESQLTEYRARSAELIKKVDATNPDNIALHEQLLLST
jgi:Protein of unknown function (DUF2827)